MIRIGSAERARRQGERLRHRVCAVVVPQLAQGFLTDRQERLGIRSRPTPKELADVFEAVLTLLYRLLFLLHAEARGLLPMREAAYQAISLQCLAEEVAIRAGPVASEVAARLEQAYSATETGLYDRLTALCRTLDHGDPVLNVPPCGNGLFLTTPDASECRRQRAARFLLRYKVPDRFLALALDCLARDQEEDTLALTFINYQTQQVQGLGAIHEALLECKLAVAADGKISLANNKAGRRASGSYYTPEDIVKYLVAHTVGVVLDHKLEALRTETQNGSMESLVEQLLELKILDPAMGSGHFLVEAVHCITDRLLRFLSRLPRTPLDINHLKQHILTRCIHGVDVDPLAVELARISLYLDAGIPGLPLGVLNDHLRCGDSLRDMTRDGLRFDVVLGNPPYDVLAGKELATDLGEALAYFRRQPVFAPARGGKMNLYKLFVCLGVDLLREGGRLGYIVPMALLGDEQAVGVRKLLLQQTPLVAVEAFPQKDDPRRRVFADAKLSTCVLIAAKSADAPFRCRVHPGKAIEDNSPSLMLHRDVVKLYDPENQPIVTCSQEDWDLAVRLLSSGRLRRLGEYARAYQGEVNEKTDADRGHISSSPDDGPLILRGAHLCRYALRAASQGSPIYLRQDEYLQGKRPGAKAWHFCQHRVGFQRSAPQNNFRRLIACFIPPGRFCCDTVSYFPEEESRLPLAVLLALFNSKLLDWFFRLGSTGSKVNDYQVRILPVPAFATIAGHHPAPNGFMQLIAEDEADEAFRMIEPLVGRPPFPGSLMTCMIHLVERIAHIEAARGEIPRSARSTLDSKAQSYQDLLDRMIYRMAGLTDAESAGLECRLARML